MNGANAASWNLRRLAGGRSSESLSRDQIEQDAANDDRDNENDGNLGPACTTYVAVQLSGLIAVFP
jgi:hypothetical protein